MKWAMLACDLAVLAWGASLAGREVARYRYMPMPKG